VTFQSYDKNIAKQILPKAAKRFALHFRGIPFLVPATAAYEIKGFFLSPRPQHLKEAISSRHFSLTEDGVLSIITR